MPYPETCPECGGAFRNTGSHFTARRNEVGRHVLLELGCQATSRRFWWDFTSGGLTAEGRSARAASHDALVTSVTSNGSSESTNGHALVATIQPPVEEPDVRELETPELRQQP